MKTSRHIVCVVYDPLIEKHLGTKPAQAFDWLYSFLHLKEGSGTIRDGRKWVKFTYKQLEEVSNALPNAYAWRRALEKLEKWGLVISEESEKKDGKWYAIHFFAVRALIGKEEFSNGFELDMVNQKTAKWMNDYHWEKQEEYDRRIAEKRALAEKLRESNERIKSEQDAQAEPSKMVSPPPEQDAQGGLSEMHRGTEQDAQICIYIESFDSFFDKKDDSTLPNGSGAPPPEPVRPDYLQAPESLKPAKDVFTAISRIACNGLAVSTETRRQISAVIATVQNTLTVKKENLVLDVATIEDYSIWRMLLDWKGEKNGFPSIKDFEAEFRFQFLAWYKSDTQRQKIEFVKSGWTDWRDRLYEGDYAAFRAEVQSALKPASPRGTQSPLHRNRPSSEVISIDDD